jgi:excisionase family DNA binding protein
VYKINKHIGKEVKGMKVGEEKDLMRVRDVARKLGLSEPHIYTLATLGRLPSVKLGRAVRFRQVDVDRFIRDHRRGKGKAA